MEIYRDLSEPAAGSEQAHTDGAASKMGENKENINTEEEGTDTRHNVESSRLDARTGRALGLRERRVSLGTPGRLQSSHRGNPGARAEKDDPVEVSQRTVLEDVTHRYNSGSSLGEAEVTDDESMMEVSSENTVSENSRPSNLGLPRYGQGSFPSQPYGGGSTGFTRRMR